MRFPWFAVALAAGVLSAFPVTAGEEDYAGRLTRLEARLADQDQRIKALELQLARVSDSTVQVRTVLERELAQPMLLLVGTGPCPYGFKRIVTRVLILTHKRDAQSGPIFDEAGLTEEDPPSVGVNVYRDLDFCFRPANAVGIE